MIGLFVSKRKELRRRLSLEWTNRSFLVICVVELNAHLALSVHRVKTIWLRVWVLIACSLLVSTGTFPLWLMRINSLRERRCDEAQSEVSEFGEWWIKNTASHHRKGNA